MKGLYKIFILILVIIIIGIVVLAWDSLTKNKDNRWNIYEEERFAIECPGEWSKHDYFDIQICQSEGQMGYFSINMQEYALDELYSKCGNFSEAETWSYMPMSALGKTTVNNLDFCITEYNFEGEYSYRYIINLDGIRYSIGYELSGTGIDPLMLGNYIETSKIQAELKLLPEIVETFKLK